MRNVQRAPFAKAFESVSVGDRKLQARDYLAKGEYPVVDQGRPDIAGYSNDRKLVFPSAGPFILFGDHTRVVKFVDFPFVVGADGVRLYRARDGYNPEYLYFFLRSAKLPKDGYGRHSKYLAELQVPTLGFGGQQCMVARLKAQLAAAEQARQAAQAQLGELTMLANAVIRESVGDSEPRSVGDVLEEVKQGIGAGWADYPVLGATRAGLAPAKESVGKHPERYKPVRCGTVFYNPMRILIGSIAMVDDGDAEGMTSPDYVVLHGRAGEVDTRWFYYWLRSPLGAQCIASLARGAVRERMLFNRLAEGTIDLPDFDVQRRASHALAQIRPLQKAIEAQLADIEALPARLLAQAFDSVNKEVSP